MAAPMISKACTSECRPQHGGELAAEYCDVLGLTLPADLKAWDCLRMRVATTPWRRSSFLSACSFWQRCGP